MAGVEGQLGHTAVQLHRGLNPSDEVATSMAGTCGHLVNLAWRQNAAPHVEVRKLTNEGLRGIKPATQRVLGEEGREGSASGQKGMPHQALRGNSPS